MTTTTTNFKSIQLLRQWCMLTLPTVFNDALSYNEQVCKLTEAINEMATTINGLPDYIIELVKELLEQMNLEEIVKKVLADYFFINVKNPPAPLVGAKGDGIANDTTAIQAMIDYVAGKKTYLFFPGGIYSVNQLVMKTGVSLIGEDRYRTIINLEAASNVDLLGGEMGDCTIGNLTLSANMPGQTQNCSIYNGNVGDMLWYNVILKNAYDVMSMNIGSLVQMDNIIVDGTQGNGLMIDGERCTITNLDFVNTSELNNNTLLTLNSNYAVIDKITCFTAIKNGINVAGNYCWVDGVIQNAITPVTNTGVGNVINISTANNNIVIKPQTSESYSGGLTVSAPSSTELIAGDKTVNASGVSVTANGTMEVDGHTDIVVKATNKVDVSSSDLILNPTNPLTYKEPLPLMNNFSYVPAKSTGGLDYKILTTAADSLEIGDVSAIDYQDGGIESSILYYANSTAYVLKFKPTSVKILPTNGNVSGDPHTNQLPIGAFALTRPEIVISNSGFEGASVFNGTYNARRDADVAFYAGFTTNDINLLKALNGEKDQSAITALGDNVDPVASPLVQNHVKYDYTEIVNSPNEAIKNHFNTILGVNPRKIIAVDDNGYFYVISVAGRNLMNKGWTYDDCINFCSAQNYKTAVQMDGGGSVQTVVDKVSVIDNFSQSTPEGRDVLTAILWEVNL